MLMVTRLDRLARSTRDLLNTLGTITERKAGSNPLATLGRIRERTRTADAHSARTGWRSLNGSSSAPAPVKAANAPKPAASRWATAKMTPHQIKEALHRRNAGEPMRDIARSYNVSHSTISPASRMIWQFHEAISIDGAFPGPRSPAHEARASMTPLWSGFASACTFAFDRT